MGILWAFPQPLCGLVVRVFVPFARPLAWGALWLPRQATLPARALHPLQLISYLQSPSPCPCFVQRHSKPTPLANPPTQLQTECVTGAHRQLRQLHRIAWCAPHHLAPHQGLYAQVLKAGAQGHNPHTNAIPDAPFLESGAFRDGLHGNGLPFYPQRSALAWRAQGRQALRVAIAVPSP